MAPITPGDMRMSARFSKADDPVEDQVEACGADALCLDRCDSTICSSELENCSHDEVDDQATVCRVKASPSPQDTLMIFDWDDTLFPTSWLETIGVLHTASFRALLVRQRAALRDVAMAAMACLKQAMQYGHVVIITNGIAGWVQDSCLRFMPSLAPTLMKLTIVSARSSGEAVGLSSPTDWKIRAFQAEIQRLLGERLTGDRRRQGHVVSVGDSMHERCAVFAATAGHPRCFAKAVRFAASPPICRLAWELRRAAAGLHAVVTFDGDLDLEVEAGLLGDR